LVHVCSKDSQYKLGKVVTLRS